MALDFGYNSLSLKLIMMGFGFLSNIFDKAVSIVNVGLNYISFGIVVVL